MYLSDCDGHLTRSNEINVGNNINQFKCSYWDEETTFAMIMKNEQCFIKIDIKNLQKFNNHSFPGKWHFSVMEIRSNI